MVMRRKPLVAAGVFLGVSLAIAAWLLPTGREQPPMAFAAPRAKTPWPLSPSAPETQRVEALRRARVWIASDTAAADLASNPPDPAGTLSDAIVRCRYLDGAAHGTTAKFDCVLPDGEVVKVKYGYTGEIQAEIAATRLLTALGFGADYMYLVPRLRCYGCMRSPFYTNWVFDRVHARELLVRSIPDDAYSDFDSVSVERRFGGLPIAAGAREGWAWFELDTIDPSLQSGEAERDALRLAAMLVAHWDNKASNQRLVCLASAPPAPSPCPRPFALINDLGATFGPNKVDLDHWKAAPIWSDRARCTVSMEQFPYSGSTFYSTTISEAGRQLIARQLTALSERQILALFSAAHFPDARGWTAALLDRVRQIADGTPCPL
jgi:hypothetical protein